MYVRITHHLSEEPDVMAKAYNLALGILRMRTTGNPRPAWMHREDQASQCYEGKSSLRNTSSLRKPASVTLTLTPTGTPSGPPHLRTQLLPLKTRG